MATVSPYRLSLTSPAAQLVRQKLENKELTEEEAPKTVWELDIMFQQHKLANFRAMYNRVRKSLGIKICESASNILEKICSMEAENEYERDQTDYLENNTDHDDKTSAQVFLKEPATLTPRITILFVLPSGVEKSGFSVRVIDRGTKLEIIVKWPAPTMDLKLMHKKWLTSTTIRYEEYHPELTGFVEAMKEHRFRSSD